MPQISEAEYRSLPLRVHAFLADVPLHDVWAVDLPRSRQGVTLATFLERSNQSTSGSIKRLSLPARVLFDLRLLLGRIFGLEAEPKDARAASFANRLTAEDRARSSVTAGTGDGLFRVLYRFENEQVLELQNRTVHAAVASALTEGADGYRFYFAVYVRTSNRFTPLYMALIDPFRRWIIYPALLKNIHATWASP